MRIVGVVFGITLLCSGVHAAAGQNLGAAQRQALADSLQTFARRVEHAMRSANADSILVLYGRPGEFVNIEDGQVVPYAKMAEAIRAFTRSVTSADVSWASAPVVVVLNRDAAVLYGTHHFAGGGGHPPHRGIWSAVLQRIDNAWKIVHAHGSDAAAERTSGMEVDSARAQQCLDIRQQPSVIVGRQGIHPE